MSTLERYSLNISNKIGNKLKKTKEEISVLNYGLFVMLHTSTVIIAMLITGIITNSVREIMIIGFCSAMLKRYSGGIHASSPMKCLILGVTMSLILSLIAKTIVNVFSPIYFFIVIIIGISVSYLVLYFRCPIGSKQKPLKNENKRILLRKKSFKIMNMCSISIFSLYVLYIFSDSDLIKSICVSILFGVLIQIFAMTKFGEKIIMSFDRILDI